MAQGNLSRFDHLVVVMFENRSFDNLLGYRTSGALFRSSTGDRAAARYSNPVPLPYIPGGDTRSPVRMSPGGDAGHVDPNPDPGEEYQHVNTQLYNLIDPAAE